MGSIRIVAPTALSAHALADLLAGRCETRVGRRPDGSWEITAELGRETVSTVPQLLSVARGWMEQFRLPRTLVTVGDETHLLEAVPVLH